jgi:hypothetical protein
MLPAFMKKLALLVSLVFLLPAVARALTPTPGHYGSSSTGVAHVTFDLGVDGAIHNLKIGGKHVANQGGHLNSHHKFTFNHRTSPFRYVGEGDWTNDTKCEGHFRIYLPSSTEFNSYHTWHAHLLHE